MSSAPNGNRPATDFLPAVELRELRAFLSVAEELHFGRAAERLGITPSYVSQTIRTLEAKIGGRLLDRTSRRVRLTSLGEELRSGIERSYRELLDSVSAVRTSATGVAGVLRLGMYTPINGGPHMLDIIRAFESRHPECRVALIDTGFGRDQVQWLRDSEADLLAMRLPLHADDVVIGPILSRELRVLAVATDHPLADRESVSVEDLVPYAIPDVPTLPREMMEALIPSHTPSGKELHRVELRSISEAMMRVASHETVHPTVPSFAQYHQHPGVTTIPIRDLPPSETALVRLASNRSPKIEAFLHVAVDVLSTSDLSSGRPEVVARHPTGAAA
jgi:DNA-binding transcriptional LysR family regulator